MLSADASLGRRAARRDGTGLTSHWATHALALTPRAIAGARAGPAAAEPI